MQRNYGQRGDGNRQRGRGGDNESNSPTRGTYSEGQWDDGQSSRETGGYDSDHDYGNFARGDSGYRGGYDEGRYGSMSQQQGGNWNEPHGGRYGGGQYGGPGFGQSGPYGGSQQPFGGGYGQYGQSGDYGQSGQYRPYGQYGSQPGGRMRGQSGRGGLGAGESFRGVGPKGYTRSDDRIKEEICECLTDDAAIDASNISIEVKDGVVTLTGTVDDRHVKHRVEDLAEETSGVKDVENRLTVQRRETSGRGASASPSGQPSRTTSASAESLKKH